MGSRNLGAIPKRNLGAIPKIKPSLAKPPTGISSKVKIRNVASSNTEILSAKWEKARVALLGPKKPSTECVKVIVRCRPMSEKEISEGYSQVVHLDPSRGVVEITNPKLEGADAIKRFTFDAVYDVNAKQQDLYDESFRPLVDSVLDGFNGTIFAYGQTGTGKTYTMEGEQSSPEKRGVIPTSFDHIFNHIARSEENKQYLVRASFLEIYQEDIRDLLHKDHQKRLLLKERADCGVYVKDLTAFVCKSIQEIDHVMVVGSQNRTIRATNMNAHSSRSHAIFIITVECSEADKQNKIRVGKLNLVDLAGSERQAKTGAKGQRLKEASKINLSLSALGNVISALVDGRSLHIPYRDSKLTRLLQDSLGGNSKTVMVANIGPASYNYDETLTTLRFANRAKNIKNDPHINEDPKDALLREFQQEIARLRATLAEQAAKRKKKKKKRKKKETKTEDNLIKAEEKLNKDSCPDNEEQSEESSDEEMTSLMEQLLKEHNALEQEKQKILNDTKMMKEQKDKFMRYFAAHEEELKREKEHQHTLLAKIKHMESKLLCGGKNIIDHTNEQQRALEKQRQEIAEQKRREREMLQKLEVEEESTVEIRETYCTLHQEVEMKTKKLKKLFGKLQNIKHDIADATEEFNRDRRDLELTQNELMRELKLKYLIIENFIPPEEKAKIMGRVRYDDENDTWIVFPPVPQHNTAIMKRPVSAVGSRRPVSEYARFAALMGGVPRYKAENIMTLELDMPIQTTLVYDTPKVAPKVQAALDAALCTVERDVDIDASSAVLNSGGKLKSSRREKCKVKNRPKIAKDLPQRAKPDSAASIVYPQARGLVPK